MFIAIRWSMGSRCTASLAWLLTRSPHLAVIPGTKRVAYLEENVAAVSIAFSASELSELNAAVAAIRIQGDSAHYTPSTDTITMPDRERFFTTTTASAEQNWYAILLHELVHWTGADHRLARTFGKRFGDD